MLRSLWLLTTCLSLVCAHDDGGFIVTSAGESGAGIGQDPRLSPSPASVSRGTYSLGTNGAQYGMADTIDLAPQRRNLATLSLLDTCNATSGCAYGAKLVCWQYAPGLWTQICTCPTCQYYPPATSFTNYTCGACNRVSGGQAWTCPESLFGGCGATGDVSYCHASQQGTVQAASYTEACGTLTSHYNHISDYCGYW